MKSPNQITLLAVGDIMLGDSACCFGHGVGSGINVNGPLFPFDHVSEVLREGDINFGNLEAVLSRHDRMRDSFASIEYRAQPEAVEGLVHCGFNLLNIATNHTMEHGQAALEETLDLMATNNLKAIGVDIPQKEIKRHDIIEMYGIRFCFLGYNFRPQQYFLAPPCWPNPSLKLIQDDLNALRDKADYFIVSLHWGDEFIAYPSPQQVEMGHALIDSGVHVVLGHHPHMIQGVEKYNGGVIAYSLGNFVFDMWQERLRKSMILKIVFKLNVEIEYKILPVLINRNYQPEIVTGEEGKRLQEELVSLSQEIPLTESKKYLAEMKVNLHRFRREVHQYYLTNLWRYNLKHLIANFVGAAKKRM